MADIFNLVSLTMKTIHLLQISLQMHSLLVSEDSLLAMAALHSFGMTGVPILLELHVRLRNSIISWLASFHSEHDLEVHSTTSPHFGGHWEAAVKSMKTHLRQVVGDVKLTFEEFYMVLMQIEACLNSRLLVPVPDSDERIEALTPGHFLIGTAAQSTS